jgi:hypothetical protein
MLCPPCSARFNEHVTLSPVAALAKVCGRRGCCSPGQNMIVIYVYVDHIQTTATVQMAWVQLQTFDSSPKSCRSGRFEVDIKIGVRILSKTISN